MVEIGKHCIRCGLCIDLHPDMFKFNYEDDKIDILPEAQNPDKQEVAVGMAADCPVAAIRVKK